MIVSWKDTYLLWTAIGAATPMPGTRDAANTAVVVAMDPMAVPLGASFAPVVNVWAAMAAAALESLAPSAQATAAPSAVPIPARAVWVEVQGRDDGLPSAGPGMAAATARGALHVKRDAKACA